MEFVILDLEWNAAYSRRLHGYINEIIEFGAVKCGPDLQVKSTFSCFVKPQVGKRLNSFTASLTNLTEENLTDGLTFMAAVSKFKKWAGDSLLMTWGSSDILTLIENCRYFSGCETVPFLYRYCDLQPYVQSRLGLPAREQLGVSTAAELLELDVSEMVHHRALDDSLMTLAILQKTYRRDALRPFVSQCDEEFYRRITFKTAYICDLHHPLVEKSHLSFSCPQCGGKTRRTNRWSLKNKSFRANFQCAECGHRFAGRLLIKQKYEGLIVSKKTFPVPVLEQPRAPVPGPVGNLRLEISPAGQGVLRFPSLESCRGVNAAFSTRIGGVSSREFAAMNLGFQRGDSPENVEENYRLFCEAAGFEKESLVTGSQDHHVNIRRVGAAQRGIGLWREQDQESVDGLCTNEPGVTLVIYCADCVPLYFVDESRGAIGLAHAGWRGTAAGMAREMILRMAAEFGSRPEDLKAAIGPSICRDCFEVDPPVAQEFLALDHADRFVFGPVEAPSQDGPPLQKYHVDLWECNRQFLLATGVLPEHIAVSEVCTMCESDLLFSHRKTRGKRGSNCAMLSLKPAVSPYV